LNILADDVDIICMYKKIGNDNCIENRLTFQGSSNPFVFNSAAIVCPTDYDIAVTNN